MIFQEVKKKSRRKQKLDLLKISLYFLYMLRVPVNVGLDLTRAKHLRAEFLRYKREVEKNPRYGSKRAARDLKRKHFHESK